MRFHTIYNEQYGDVLSAAKNVSEPSEARATVTLEWILNLKEAKGSQQNSIGTFSQHYWGSSELKL